MTQYLTNSTARIAYEFTADGEPESPSSASISSITRPDGTVVLTSLTPTLSDGTVSTYYYDIPAATISTYTGAWSATWVFTLGAQTLTETVYYTVGTSANVLSMRQIRRAVARSLRDLWQIVATSNGTAYTIVDSQRLYQIEGFFEHAWVMSTWGTPDNIGAEREVGGFSSNTMTLYQPLETASLQGDEFDTHKRWTFTEYHQAIDDALNEVYPNIFQPVVDETITTTSGVSVYNVDALPYPISHLGHVELETITNRPWRPISAALDPDKHILRLGNNPIPGGKKLRIYYEARIRPMTSELDSLDADEIRLEAIKSFLAYAVPVRLFYMQLSTAPSAQVPGLERQIEKYEKKAKDALQSVRMRRIPGRVIDGTFGVPGYPPSTYRPGDYFGGGSV